MEGGIMLTLADSIYTLQYNPFTVAPLYVEYYKNLVDVSKNLFLSKLLLPLCFHPELGMKVERANMRSSVWTIFNDKRLLIDINERIDEFDELNFQTLQYAMINGWISIDVEKFSVQATKKEKPVTAIKYNKRAANLGKLFSGLSVMEIFSILGAKPK